VQLAQRAKPRGKLATSGGLAFTGAIPHTTNTETHTTHQRLTF